MKVFFILGGPGSGKGTICSKIKNNITCEHICVGDLLRKEQSVKDILDKGEIVPSIFTIKMVLNAINNSSHEIILLDGFPRNIENLDIWLSTTDIKYKCIFLHCNDDILKSRLSKRKRSDDTVDIIDKRISLYHDNTKALLIHFTKKTGII